MRSLRSFAAKRLEVFELRFYWGPGIRGFGFMDSVMLNDYPKRPFFWRISSGKFLTGSATSHFTRFFNMQHRTRSCLRPLGALTLIGPFVYPGKAASGPRSSTASRGLCSDGLNCSGGTVADAGGLSAVPEIAVFHSDRLLAPGPGVF